MKERTQKVEWSGTRGQKLAIEIRLVLSKSLYNDGDTTVVDCCDIFITATADGKTIGYGHPEKVDPPRAVGDKLVVAKIGTLGLDADTVIRYGNAVCNVCDCDEWRSWQAKLAQAKSENAKWDKYQAGLCPKCGSYCEGDCEASRY